MVKMYSTFIILTTYYYKNLVIYFTRYVNRVDKNVKFVLSRINGKIEKHERKKFSLVVQLELRTYAKTA